MTSHRFLAPSVAALLVILSGGNAFAQTIAAGGQPYPNRIVHGMNLGFSTRPEKLTPLGINNLDCLQDMTLQFTVTVSGFTGTDSIEVWGSLDSDCTAMTDRGIGATAAARCWGLRAGNVIDPIVNNPQSYTFNVRVQDLVGWEHGAPTAAESANPPAQGATACNAQTTPGAVAMNVNFLAVDASGNVDGTPYQYQLATDLVAPPGPAGVSVSTTGADWVVTWTPNTDKDTVGYDVFFGSAPATDAGPAACQTASIALQGNAEPTVYGASVGSYDLGPAQSDTQAAVSVAAMDAFGNMHEGTSPTCDTAGTVEADGPGVSCAVAPRGEAGATIACLGLLAAAGGLRRRRMGVRSANRVL